MSSRTTLFQASETLPGTVTAVLLRQYVGVNVEVQETLHGGKAGFTLKTSSPADTKARIADLKEALRRQSQDRGRPQVDHSYRQGTADAYSSMTSSNGYNRPTAVNSTPAYPGPHNTYGAQHGAGLSAYDRPSGINTMDDDADDGTLLSRRSSRDDAYRRYPSSDRADSESLYGSSPRTQPINIVPQRRPSTSSDASDNSFDGMYGFRSSVASQGSRGFPGSPRGDFHSPNNVYGRR